MSVSHQQRAPISQWVSGRCTCEICTCTCTCTCNKKFDLSNHARIAHLGMNPNAARDNDSAPDETRDSLRNMISVGATAAAQADEDGTDTDNVFQEELRGGGG